MNKKNMQHFTLKGFTLIELLAVMVIILVLAGLFVGVGGPARESARKRKAEVMISALEVAIGMYKADTGSYPADDGGTGNINLYDELVNGTDFFSISPWAGPYMEFKEGDLDATKTWIKDPWDNAYNYDSSSATRHNANSFDLWSTGKDVSDAGDDIENW